MLVMIKRFSFLLSLLGVLLVTTSGFADYLVTEVVNGGAVKGRVNFKGEPPPEANMLINADQQVCGSGYRKLKRLVLSPRKTIVNAVVTLEGVSRGKPFPKAVQLIDQHDCAFIPHIQVARMGREFVILNSDPVHHNIHGYLNGRTIFNLAQPMMGKRIPVVLTRPGIIEVKCDIHPWMQGWVLVVEHPYYAVTDQDGEFLIDRVPPGTYRLTVWQEMMGVMEQEVTIKPGATLDVDFSYRFNVK
jgi:plastocyanin